MARLTYTQYADFLNALYSQVTGNAALTSADFGDYVSVFTADHTITQDNLYGILDTMIQRTIFAVRPYSRKLAGLEWDAARYGDITRKLTPVSVGDIDNPEWSISEELAKQNPDFRCCTAPVLQDFLATYIQGGNTYARKWTIFRDQMNAAFRSPEEVAAFFNMLITERQNRHELDYDSQKMNLICNYILAIHNEARPTRVIKVLTEYNGMTQGSFTAETIMRPDNFRPFMIWLAARIKALRELMTRKTSLFITKITGKDITRFSPYDRQRLYIHSQFAAYFEANKALLFNPDKVGDFGDYESVPYWQNPASPYSVYGDAKGLSASGTAVDIEAESVDMVIGFIQDVDAMGVSNISMWSASEPYSARFGYQNTWYHDTFRHITDFPENGLILLLE